MNKVGNGNYIPTMKWCNMHPRCTQECACKIFSNNTIICPIPFAQECGHVLHISEPVGNHLNRIVLVIKAYIWGTLYVIYLFIFICCEGPIKVAHYKKSLNFGMHSQLINMDCKFLYSLLGHMIYTLTHPKHLHRLV
jgi:hypothetical protein